MPKEDLDTEQASIRMPNELQRANLALYRTNSQEHILTALALLLGPETDYHIRVQATRRLVRQGASSLPLVLTTLNNYPEITSPPWPWWPPQYEHCSRLLLRLCHIAGIQIDTLLQHPLVASQPIGPVLWASVVEAIALHIRAEHETLLRQSLAAPWETVRYAAAMALANLAGKLPLQKTTLEALHACQGEEEAISIRVAASYTLLQSDDQRGVEVLIKLLEPSMPTEARKAAAFVLATEPPQHLSHCQREHLIDLLLGAIQDQHGEMALHAASALSRIASPSTLPALCALLASSHPQLQIAVLTALEEMMKRKGIRRAMQQHTLPADVVPLLRSPVAEVRRQASYTLAALGGAYAAAVLGTILLDSDHAGQVAAIEGLRLLQGVFRMPARTRVVRWLLCTLRQSQEEVQVTALDSLAYLAWRSRAHGLQRAHHDICDEIVRDGTPFQLLACSNAWVRQRAIELLCLLEDQPQMLHTRLLELLHTDDDSGVRACVAYILGQIAAQWAIPDLLLSLLDSDEHVAATALNSLGQLASPDNSIVAYVLKELAGCSNQTGHAADRLVQPAQALLKKWRNI